MWLFSMKARYFLQIYGKAVHNSSRGASASVDISGLKPRHRIIASGGIPPIEFEWECERNAQRAHFGRFGLKSGVDIGVSWPTLQELEEQRALGLYQDYNSAISELNSVLQKEKLQENARMNELEKKMAKYPDVIAKYEASQVKAEKERDEKEIALEKRIREIQEYFGYWMDPKDPRFEVMLEQKEQEEKKAEKMAKRAESQKKKIAEVL